MYGGGTPLARLTFMLIALVRAGLLGAVTRIGCEFGPAVEAETVLGALVGKGCGFGLADEAGDALGARVGNGCGDGPAPIPGAGLSPALRVAA